MDYTNTIISTQKLETYRLDLLFKNPARLAILITLLLVSLIASSKTLAQATCQAFDPPDSQFGLALENVLPASTLARPVAMVQPPNDSTRWFVVDNEGQVVIFKHGTTFSKSGVLVDLTDRVVRRLDGRTWNELGLLSIAVHPNFNSNGYVYLYYSAQGPSTDFPLAARLARYTSRDNGETLDPNSEKIIFELPRDTVHHWGGQMWFHPVNGYLYMSIGDGGRKPKAQRYDDLNGSFIRINVNSGNPYSIPPDNPFVNVAGRRGEIYAKGLRNPWQWSFDSVSHRIFLGDVGAANWEEINEIKAGRNYGWPIKEGFECFNASSCNSAGLTDPVVAYPHDVAGFVAVLGGYIYRGSNMPDFYGKYIYGDVTGRIWSIDPDDPNPVPDLVLDAGPYYYGFAEDHDRELYLLGNNSIEKLKQSSGSGSGNKLPELLSETGCFSNDPSSANTSPALIPYQINTPLWSDNADKQRWMRLPDNGRINVSSTHDWTFPVGSVLVKNFKISNKLIETRLFIRHQNGDWAGYSYEWDDNQTDAKLVMPEGKKRAVGNLTWLYPSRSQCMQCHTPQAGFVLGPETAQLNLDYPTYSLNSSSNQLTGLAKLNIFENANFSDPSTLPKLASIDDVSQTKHWRARSYLYSNCAMCHTPGGSGRGPEDFRYSVSDSQMGAINVNPSVDNLGIANGKLISPGQPNKSIMSLRMHSINSSVRMPPLATRRVDREATDLIDQWITSLALPTANFNQTCGRPIITSNNPEGVYLWRRCGDPLRWYFRVFADDTTKQFKGKIISTSAITNIKPIAVDTTDQFLVSQSGKRVSFDFKSKQRDTDGFDISLNANAGACLSFDFPKHTQIWLGKDNFEVKSNTLNLKTLSNCTQAIVPGAPDISPGKDEGIHIWQRDKTTWVIKSLGDNVNQVSFIKGSITSNMPFTSVIPHQTIESGDKIDSKYPGLIDFNINVIKPYSDDFEFSVPENADLCFNLENQNYPVYFGASKKQITYPYNLSSAGPCKQINVDGKPEIDPNQDKGIFLWRDQNVWHINSTTYSNYFFVQGSVQAYNKLIDWKPLTFELNNNTDFFKTNNKNRIDFRTITSANDQDEFSFVINESIDSCIDIAHPASAPVFLGPDKKRILPPYDLSTLQPCRHVDP